MASINNNLPLSFIPQKNILEKYLELDTVIGSDLFSQDEYYKQYLLDLDLSLISKIKIGLRYYITDQPELILQLTVFKGYLEEINPFLYMEVFGKDHKDSKKW